MCTRAHLHLELCPLPDLLVDLLVRHHHHYPTTHPHGFHVLPIYSIFVGFGWWAHSCIWSSARRRISRLIFSSITPPISRTTRREDAGAYAPQMPPANIIFSTIRACICSSARCLISWLIFSSAIRRLVSRVAVMAACGGGWVGCSGWVGVSGWGEYDRNSHRPCSPRYGLVVYLTKAGAWVGVCGGDKRGGSPLFRRMHREDRRPYAFLCIIFPSTCCSRRLRFSIVALSTARSSWITRAASRAAPSPPSPPPLPKSPPVCAVLTV